MNKDREIEDKTINIERMVDDIFVVLNALRDTTKDRIAALYSRPLDERPGRQDKESESGLS